MRLVCVVFTEESPYQFEETVTLFKYGFENFKKLSVKEHETQYEINNMDLFDTENDLFGDSTPLISLENDTYVTIPNKASFNDISSSLVYHDNQEAHNNIIATINYNYFGTPIGTCDVMFEKTDTPAFGFGTSIPSTLITTTDTGNNNTASQKVIFINIKKLIFGIILVTCIVMLILFILSVIKNYNFPPRGQSSKRRRKRRQESRIARKRAKLNSKRFNKKGTTRW